MSARTPTRALALVIASAAAIFAGPRAVAQNITANAYTPSDTDIEMQPAYRADLNRDGTIDSADVRLFLETRKAGKQGNLVTDINADGRLDQTDLASILELIAAGAAPPKPVQADGEKGAQAGVISRTMVSMVSAG